MYGNIWRLIILHNLSVESGLTDHLGSYVRSVFNSLIPNMWHCESWSPLVQVMTCCLLTSRMLNLLIRWTYRQWRAHSIRCYLKFRYFQSRICIWNYFHKNGSFFIQNSMFQSKICIQILFVFKGFMLTANTIPYLYVYVCVYKFCNMDWIL